jgi:hypothetical protein
MGNLWEKGLKITRKLNNIFYPYDSHPEWIDKLTLIFIIWLIFLFGISQVM